MCFYDLALRRRSIRKYADQPIPQEDIDTMLRAAVSAPSACNSQNWHFVVLKTPASIERLALAVESGVARVMHELNLDDEPYLSNRIRHATFFRKAPVVFVVYMEPMTYYEPRVTEALTARGLNYDERAQFLAQPDLLTIGAAIENLLLCAQDLGYGGCWMNDPVMAADEINACLGQKPPRKLVSIVPIGVPAYTPREKTLRQDFAEYQ